LLNGHFFCCSGAGRLEADGRQVVLGPLQQGSLGDSVAISTLSPTPVASFLVTRKIFVPTGGRFARYLEIVTNPTGVTLNATVRVEGDLGSDSRTRIVVSPEATSNTFAVTDQSGVCCDPALAHVFSGAGAVPVRPRVVSFGPDGNDSFSYEWGVSIPPNGTVMLMHFAVQR